MFYSYYAHTYIDINVLRLWSPYMELSNRHPKKVTDGQCHININSKCHIVCCCLLMRYHGYIKTMYKADFCQLEMINSSNLFQIYKRIIKKNFRELSMFYLKINRNVLHIHEYSY